MKGNFDHLYREPRKYCVVNNGDGIFLDPDLHPIVYRLPEAPKDNTKFKNYGLHPDEQYYRRDILPSRLKQLEKETIEIEQDKSERSNYAVNGYKLQDTFWSLLKERQQDYREEINFIKMVVYKRVYGEWVYIDGKLTWIPPWYYMLLNWWTMDGVTGNDGHPEFRIRDWKSYIHKTYTYTCTETFEKIDKFGYAIAEDDGTYQMKDVGDRLFYGDIQPKNRRSGATHHGLEINHEIICIHPESHATIVSKNKDDVEQHWKTKFIPAWQNMPLFMRPVWDGNNEPGTKLEYKAPDNVFSFKSLKSSYFIVKNVGETVVDSMRLSAILVDEQGKATGGGRVDVSSRHRITRQTLSTGGGANIKGFMTNPSTAEEMEDGAKEYLQMCSESDFYQRNAIGQTKSGLALVVFPAQYCLEGFIDVFGNAVVNTPTERQCRLTPHARFARQKIGAREYLLSSREAHLNDKTPAGEKAYREEMRKQPMSYAEIWSGSGGDIGFPMEEIDRRMAEARRHNGGEAWIRRGNFEWEGGIKDGRVLWKDNDKGKFELSYYPSEDQTNLKTSKLVFDSMAGGLYTKHFAPIGPKLVIGADPIDFDNRSKAKLRDENSSKSDGGIAGYYPFDPTVDEDHNDPKNSDRFILSYRYRPYYAEYNEDVLMACVYLNAWCYPERNKTDLERHFFMRGYAGYLKYDIDIKSGKPVSRPGYWMDGNSKTEMFILVNDYLERNAHRERHTSFLEECKQIRTPDELNTKDRLAAHGAALMGARGMLSNAKKMSRGIDIKRGYQRLFGV